MSAMNSWKGHADVCQVIQRWAFSRDNGRWDDLANTFTPQGWINVSWFQGPHANFVRASRARHGQSLNRHIVLGTLSEVGERRAWAESQIMMVGVGAMEGKAVRWMCHFRFIDLLSSNGAGWAIDQRSAVYDFDTLSCDSQGDQLVYDVPLLERFPRGYRYLGYRLSRLGLAIGSDLPTAGSQAEQQLRSQARTWIADS